MQIIPDRIWNTVADSHVTNMTISCTTVRHIRTGRRITFTMIFTILMTVHRPSLFQILAVVIHDRIGNSAFVYLADIHNLFIFQKFQPVQQVFSAVGKVTAFSVCIFNINAKIRMYRVTNISMYNTR